MANLTYLNTKKNVLKAILGVTLSLVFNAALLNIMCVFLIISTETPAYANGEENGELTLEVIIEAIKTGVLTQVPFGEAVTLIENADTITCGLLLVDITTRLKNLDIKDVQQGGLSQEDKQTKRILRKFRSTVITKQNKLSRNEHQTPGFGNDENSLLASVIFDDQNELSFSDVDINSLFLSDGTPIIDDPLQGAELLIANTSRLGNNLNGTGWIFDDTIVQIIVDDTPVFEADLFDSFLFVGGGSHPEFDSEFQGVFENIVINNIINSPFLDDFKTYIDTGNSAHLAVFSNILSSTNNLANSGSSQALVWGDGTKKVPEPTFTIALLALGTLGVGSTLLRKQKQKKLISKAS